MNSKDDAGGNNKKALELRRERLRALTPLTPDQLAVVAGGHKGKNVSRAC